MTRRLVVGATAALGAASLAASLSATPGSKRFHLLTGATAATWTVGSLAAGPIRLSGGRPVLLDVAEGSAVGAVCVVPFVAGARVARRIGPLRRMLTSVLAYSNRGRPAAVFASTISTGVAEEIYFRGALTDALVEHPLRDSTAAYTVVTCATRNPTLVLAAVPMGAVFGWERRRTGALVAPMVAHAVWSALMLRILPPLFPSPAVVDSAADWHRDD